MICKCLFVVVMFSLLRLVMNKAQGWDQSVLMYCFFVHSPTLLRFSKTISMTSLPLHDSDTVSVSIFHGSFS